MQLDAKQMQAFLAVVESGSFEKAAERLSITPSAASQRIHALEVRLGSSVIVRGRPCEPTQSGRKLMLYLRRATVLEEELLNGVGELGHAARVLALAGIAGAAHLADAAPIFEGRPRLCQIKVALGIH